MRTSESGAGRGIRAFREVARWANATESQNYPVSLAGAIKIFRCCRGLAADLDPQPLDVAVADRLDAERRAPLGDRTRCKEPIFVGPPRRVLGRDRLDVSRRGAVQGEMGDALRKLFDEFAV